MRHPTPVHGRRHQPPPMPTVLDSAARARQRVLALFLPVAAALYISAEALNPHGTDPADHQPGHRAQRGPDGQRQGMPGPPSLETWGRIGRRASLRLPAGIRKVIML